MSREDDEVERLLRAAQDDVLLKLSLDSHTTRAAAHSIDPDLDRRYQALKAHRNPNSTSTSATAAAAASEARIDGSKDEDDLLARFSALKKSIPSHNNDNESQITSKEESDDDDDDEVEKVIKWAVDAARLDPSCTTSDDETDNETDDEVEIDKKKGKKKK
ncbi:uncharacterized protein [Henckelia pumila]|uniref:uncharacterized protein n=1 Tax=Henckelia pumila TaxID=405737 RepID=UPI003C6DE486